ncbi:MAG TPA: hypothetical protein VIJ55_04920 [Acetobacteraceae bacterium]
MMGLELIDATVAANESFRVQSEAVGAEIQAALRAWSRLIDATADGAPPAPAERLAATLGIHAVQHSIHALADALGPLSLRYDTLCGAAAGERAE